MATVLTAEMNEVREAARLGESLLVLGRAGTGKSTLLHYLREALESDEKILGVVAPTGIAALNVDGETFHKFFAFRQDLLPALSNYRPPTHLRDVDVLIIDEISMVRADDFDMMSRALSRAKGVAEPFGGTQVVMFGDLFQLPPVTDDESDSLRSYSTEFFFSADAFRRLEAKCIELSRVFRQTDRDFVDLLNDIRHAASVDSALARLNERVRDSDDDKDGPAVTIVPSNRLADSVNATMLASLNSEIFEVRAEVEGNISLQDYKVPAVIQFSVGAQVMMTVNSDEYVNGTTGVVSAFMAETGQVEIVIEEDGRQRRVYVEPHRREVWRKSRTEAVLIGAITQLPFRLAWAITVHRSQGQTFDRVIFDRDRGMFAPGQLYVALSRCRTFEGLSLRRPVQPADVRVNSDVVRFLRSIDVDEIDLAACSAAVVGFLETDAGEHGRLLEIAIEAFDAQKPAFTFSTVVNPMRDFDHAESGLTPTTVTLAPTVDEVRQLIALLLAGRHVVGFRVNRLQNHLRLNDFVDDEGLWVDVDISDSTRDAVMAADSACGILTLLRDSMVQGVGKVKAVAVGEFEGPIPSGAFVYDRFGFIDLRTFADWLSAGSDANQAPALAAVLVGHADSSAVAGWAKSRVSGDLDGALQSALNSLVHAVNRDGRVTDAEFEAVQLRSQLLGLGLAALERSSPTDALIALEDGAGICLTGGTKAEKDRMRALIESLGFIEVGSVTRSGCRLVVAKDAASASGKARKAHEYDIPVLSWTEFSAHVVGRPVTEDFDKTALLKSPLASLPSVDESEVMGFSVNVPPRLVRKWAQEHGYSVGTRGTIPRPILYEYLSHQAEDGAAG